MSEHTPGPWEVLRSAGKEWPDKRLSVAADVRVGRAKSIAISPRYPDKDLEANFDLIAAAPDLLRALRQLLVLYAGTGDERSDAEAAIAKAIGGDGANG